VTSGDGTLKFPLFSVSRICYNHPTMKTFLLALPLFALCGCLAPASAPAVSHWLMEFRESTAVSKTPKYGVVRLSQVVVGMPYSGNRLVILRKDGTVAFDDKNVFAAPPAALTKDLCFVALKSSGLFADVVETSSTASSQVFAECFVSRLALDCRQEDVRRAVAEVRIRLLTGKSITATVGGEGSADASDGDYGVAFSKALSEAVSSALSKLR